MTAAMGGQRDRVAAFRAAHVPGRPLLLPNPWDAGSARLLEAMGFVALATTSGGHAGTLGLPDGSVTRAQALAHAEAIVAAVAVPVSADLENGFADSPEEVRGLVADAAATGLAGCSIEDFTPDGGGSLYDAGLAAERVAAACEAVHAEEAGIVLTARAENFLRGNPDLDDTIARLRSYERAGADVVYAPGLPNIEAVRRVVDSVGVPVNVLLTPSLPDVTELASAGVARISVGGIFHRVTLAALHDAASELLDRGTAGFLARGAEGARLAATAFPG